MLIFENMNLEECTHAMKENLPGNVYISVLIRAKGVLCSGLHAAVFFLLGNILKLTLHRFHFIFASTMMMSMHS